MHVTGLEGHRTAESPGGLLCTHANIDHLRMGNVAVLRNR